MPAYLPSNTQHTTLFLGIDVGTSSVRVAAFSRDGGLATPVVAAPCELDPAPAGWAEIAPSKWETAICSALRELTVDLDRICAVGLSTIFPALVLMKRDGHTLRPAILYCDQRSQPQVDWLNEWGFAQEITQTSGNRVAVGTTSLTSLLWLWEHEPALFAEAEIFGHANTYLGAWLTGEIGIDASNASLSGLMDTMTVDWNVVLCGDQLQMDETKLPPIIGSSQQLGRVTAEAARITGLPEGIPVAMGAGDTVCAALGAGVRDPGQAFTTTGTTDTICLCVGQPVADPRLFLCAHAVPGRWLSLAPMSCTGGCLTWFREQALANSLSYEQLIAEAAQSPPGSNGVIFLPYLRGERSPIWDSTVRGAFAGLSAATTRGALVRAMLEASGHAMRHNLETMEQVHEVQVGEMMIAGKPSSIPLWNQIRADITGRSILVASQQEAAVRGAALLGGMAAGLLCPEDWDLGQDVKRYESNPSNRDAYERAYLCYQQLYSTTLGVFSSDEVTRW